MVLLGRAAVVGPAYDGAMEAGDIFALPPGHDTWVVGASDVSLHFLGADEGAA